MCWNRQNSDNEQSVTEKDYFTAMGIPDGPDNEKLGDELFGYRGAFHFANSCRDKEIDRFWSRGLYFWGFIVASFGGYFACLNLFLSALPNNNGTQKNLSDVYADPNYLFVLTVLAFVCFIFCLSWTLVHKGSKFWQENWETHINFLEKKLIGNIYTTYLNTSGNKCSPCILSAKPYQYSVSKVSYLGSVLLTILSFFFFGTHLVSFCVDLNSLNLKVCRSCCVGAVLIILSVAYLFWYYCVIGRKKKFCICKNKKNNRQYEFVHHTFDENITLSENE